MKSTAVTAALSVLGLHASAVNAQTRCTKVLVPTYSPPSVASGWTAQLVANGLVKPRSLIFDSAGGLLVVESGKGVSRTTFNDHGGTCLEVNTYNLIINQTSVSGPPCLPCQPSVPWAVADLPST